MKLMISAAIFDTYLKSGMCQLDLVAMADKYNCAGVEFRPYWRSPITELPEIDGFLEEYNLQATYACYDNLLGMHEAEVRASLQKIKESVDFSLKLGAKLLRINVAQAEFDPALLQAAWWNQAVHEILAYAKNCGVVLAIENAPHPRKGDPAFLKDLLQHFSSPWLRLTFDTGNWVPAGYVPEQALELLQPYVAYVHLKNGIIQNHTFVPGSLSQGEVDVLGLVDKLQQQGYQGLYALEFPGGSAPSSLIRGSMQYLHRS